MASLLVINSSPRSSSISRKLTQRFVDDWKKSDPGARIVERDLTAQPLPFVNEQWINASYTPAQQRTPEQTDLLKLSDRLIEEVLEADVIVIGVPMHNFSVPASLKAWIDLIARTGKTFSYGDRGPKGLVSSDKKVVVIGSRGGPLMPESGSDFVVPYLRHILGFIGLTNISFVHADKQGMGGDAAQAAVDKAARELSSVVEGCVNRQPVAA